MRAIAIILRRELKSQFGGPLGWVLIAAFAVLANWFFYSDLTWYVLFGGANLQLGLWRYVFLDIRMVTMVVPPLLTMRLIAEERKLGTLELLWSLPVRDHELLLAKFLTAMAVYLAMLVATLPGPLMLHVLHPFAWQPVAGGYLGLVLLGGVFIACGVAASAAAENQLVSAMLTYAAAMLFWFGGWNEAALPEALAPVLSVLSLFDRFYGFAQGVIDSRDVAYLLALTVFFLYLGLVALGSRAWRGTT